MPRSGSVGIRGDLLGAHRPGRDDDAGWGVLTPGSKLTGLHKGPRRNWLQVDCNCGSRTVTIPPLFASNSRGTERVTGIRTPSGSQNRRLVGRAAGEKLNTCCSGASSDTRGAENLVARPSPVPGGGPAV